MADILVAPAPWKLKSRSWQLFTSPLKKPTGTASAGTMFPAGWAAPYESEALAKGEFLGNLGQIMLVQYTETPVGPYDELIYTPGKFKTPDGTVGNCITRIYVSTKESTANGRRNWNIPKQVADFKYTHLPDGSWDLAVSLPGVEKPFFHVTMHPIPIISSLRIPVSTTILGSYMRIVQPPLPRGDKPELVGTDGAVAEEVEGVTGRWAALIPEIRGKMQLMTMKPLVAKEGADETDAENLAVGDGVSFPAVVPWKVGAVMEDVDVDFGLPEWL